MSALREMQTAFAAAAFAQGAERAQFFEQFLAKFSHPASRHGARGLAAYCTSIQANLAGAVVATYPVLTAIVGVEFLTAAARDYARQVPSRSGDLNRYGDDFDRFLACYAPAAPLPYLPDVARLEWRIQQVHTAPAAPVADLSALATTPSESWGSLRFRLDPGHQLLASSWPLARIWTVNQPDYQGDFTVDFDQAQSVLIQRNADGIHVSKLRPGEHSFLSLLQRGETLADAVAQASTQVADFDLGAVLQTHLASGLIRCAIAPSHEVTP